MPTTTATATNKNVRRVPGGRVKRYVAREGLLVEQTDAPMMETDDGHFYEGTETQFDITAAQMAAGDLVEEEQESEPAQVGDDQMAFVRSFAGPRTGAGGYSRAIRNEGGFVTVVVPHVVDRPVLEQDDSVGWADIDYDGEGNVIETLMPGVDIRQMGLDDFVSEWAKARIEYARDEDGKIIVDPVSGEPVCQYVNWKLPNGNPRLVPLSAILRWPNSSKPGVALSWFDAKKYADLAWVPKPATDMEATADARWVDADIELRKALGSMVTSVGKTEIGRERAIEIMLEKGAKPNSDERQLAQFALDILGRIDALTRNMLLNDNDDEESGLVGMELPVAGGTLIRYVSVDALDVAEAAVSSGLVAYMGSVGQVLRRAGDSATLEKRSVATRTWRANWRRAEADGFKAKMTCDAAFSSLERSVVEAIISLPVINRRYVVRDQQRVVETWGARGYVDASKELLTHMSGVIARAMTAIMEGAVAGRMFSSPRRDGTYNVDATVWSWLLSFAWKTYNTMTWYYQSFEKSVWTRYRIAAAVDAQLACKKIDNDRYEYLHADRNTSITHNKDGWSERNKSIVEAQF